MPPEAGSPAGGSAAPQRQALRNGVLAAEGEDLAPLPDDPERDFRVPVEDDPERASYLRPPPLPWELPQDGGAP